MEKLKQWGCRTSVFMDPDLEQISALEGVAVDRIELYTEAFAVQFSDNPEHAVQPYVLAAERAHALGFEINAGHDLSLENLRYFAEQVPHLKEVSIGHALIADALYFGLENTIGMYLHKLQ